MITKLQKAAALLRQRAAQIGPAFAISAEGRTGPDPSPEVLEDLAAAKRTYHDLLQAADDVEAAAAQLQALPADWRTDSSLNTWFPVSAEEIERLRATVASQREQISELKAQVAAGAPRPADWFAQDAQPVTLSDRTHPIVPTALKIPDGWKLVPVVANRAMIKACGAAAREYMQEHGGNSPSVMWAAMVAEAPEAPVEAGEQKLPPQPTADLSEASAAAALNDFDMLDMRNRMAIVDRFALSALQQALIAWDEEQHPSLRGPQRVENGLVDAVRNLLSVAP